MVVLSVVISVWCWEESWLLWWLWTRWADGEIQNQKHTFPLMCLNLFFWEELRFCLYKIYEQLLLYHNPEYYSSFPSCVYSKYRLHLFLYSSFVIFFLIFLPSRFIPLTVHPTTIPYPKSPLPIFIEDILTLPPIHQTSQLHGVPSLLRVRCIFSVWVQTWQSSALCVFGDLISAAVSCLICGSVCGRSQWSRLVFLLGHPPPHLLKAFENSTTVVTVFCPLIRS